MRILLVNANFKGIVNIPNLGLIFLNSYIKKHIECEIEVIEPILQKVNEEAILAKAKSVDILGLTFATESRFQAFSFAEKFKEINPECKIIVGGTHVKALDKLVLQHYPFIDIVVRGEGEEPFLDIARNKPLSEILGITWREKDEVIRNADRPLIQNIDNLPYDYSSAYHYLKNWKDTEVSYKLMKLNHMPIIASRGCPFQCSFCGAHDQWDKKWRGLSPKELVSRMKYFAREFNIGYFRFYDALFIGSEEKVLEFCDLLKKSDLNIKFRIDIRVGTKESILRRLKEVGCEVVGFGVESGSNKILRIANKRITREATIETIKLCKKIGFRVIGFFMVSFPNETLEDIEHTRNLLKYFDEANVQYFKVHPNTIFYNDFKQNGDIDDNCWFNNSYGENTAHGNEIFHSKELFPRSANFTKKDAENLVSYLYEEINKNKLRNPKNMLIELKQVSENPKKTFKYLLKAFFSIINRK